MTGSRWSGIVMIVVGVVFWAMNPFPIAFQSERWWALLLVIPVLFLIVPRARRRASKAAPSGAGRRTRPGRGRLLAAAAVVGVMGTFLLTPTFGAGWPLALVLYGLVALLA